jgi:ABC transporter substrate binding protein
LRFAFQPTRSSREKSLGLVIWLLLAPVLHRLLSKDCGISGTSRAKILLLSIGRAEGEIERYADLAGELVHLQVNIIVSDSTGMALAAKKATNTIPIVMTGRGSTDPVQTGLIANLARPGGNVTGLTNISGELAGKFWSYSKRSCRNSIVWPF